VTAQLSSCAGAIGGPPAHQPGGLNSHRRVDVALRGISVSVPVRRRGGAGPSDDGHLALDGIAATLPINPTSPYSVADGRLLFDGVDTGVAVAAASRPRFYDLSTAGGISYEKIALLHGVDVLASTVVQTCMRYGEADRCRFCAVEAPLATGATIAVKTPAQLAEVARAAVDLDGIRQMVLTTGTSTAPDRGARHLARCVRAIREVVPGLPIQVQCEPPADLSALADLRSAGADAIGIHVESLDDEVRRRWMPGKSTVPLSAYRAAWAEAVRLFGPNRVSTYLLVGLGEDPDELIAGAGELIDSGVYPFVVPYRPLAGTLAAEIDRVPGPPADVLERVTSAVGELLRRAGMRGADQGAGCAACGACSALAAVGG
jgi:radical SAM protein (TIGR04043 family)